MASVVQPIEPAAHGEIVVPATPRAIPRERRAKRWLGATRGARFRIVGSYVLLLAVSAVLLTLGLRQVLLIRLDVTVSEDLQQEVLELDRLLAAGRNPLTAKPFASLEQLFEVYFLRNVPSNEEATFAFIDGELYKSNITRFPVESIPPPVLASWDAFSSRLQIGRAHV